MSFTFHCEHCQASWVSDSQWCWLCHRPGERGQLITNLWQRNDPYTTRHWSLTEAEAAALIGLADGRNPEFGHRLTHGSDVVLGPSHVR